MVEEGKRLAGLTPNVIVKPPVGVESLTATKTLAEDDVTVNMTLVFSTPQVLPVTRAGACYIGPLVERVDDIGSDRVASLEEIVRCVHNHSFGHEYGVVAASIRSPYRVTAAAPMGTDITAVPFGALKNCVKHPLAAEGLTKFEASWEKMKNA